MLFSPNEAGGIYIVSWENSYDYVKIGMAQNFTRRLEDFLVYSPFKLNIELLFPISSTDTETLNEIEKIFHDTFLKYRVSGEWFVRQGELFRFIKLLQEMDDRTTSSISRPLRRRSLELVYGSDWRAVQLVDQDQELIGFPVNTVRNQIGVTDAEWRVVKLLPETDGNKEIAERLGISTETVKSHISSALAKYKFQNRTQLACEVAKETVFKELTCSEYTGTKKADTEVLPN